MHNNKSPVVEEKQQQQPQRTMAHQRTKADNPDDMFNADIVSIDLVGIFVATKMPE